ncbi:hypothetical protein M404DRAFT_33296 [Pisolithus tinctorius Marx 270]|uniref:Uncharacterized protein n=1 Tax=Pisolithus tinctorius Marx 270 TaxID=870435 RepID=A0A0C3NM95_PISTI|nr:hypothetical protein M404DRAFT_33296 [Pisolithus tinctorius Marx 270]
MSATIPKLQMKKEAKWRERGHETEHKAKHEEAKRQKAEEERLEAEQRKRVEEEEEAQRKKVAEEEAERQRQRASEERAQARQDEAAQSAVYDVNTAQKVPGTSVVPDSGAVQARTRQDQGLHALSQEEQGKGKERVTETEEVDDEQEAGGEEDEPATPLEGPSGVRVHTQWAEWEWEQQLQAMEKQAEVHETTVLAFERMAEAAEQMAAAAEQTANEWALYCTWAEWAEMRRREDM